MHPYITIVMPVRNEARFIRGTLTRLLEQDYPADRFEIIVADGMSDDGTQATVLELAESYPQIRLMENPRMLSSAGRNIGFANGKGDYFLVVDGHCHIPDEKLLQNVADCFAKSGADCLGRPQPLDPPELSGFQEAVALARGSKLGHGGDSLIYGDYEGFASPVSNGAAYRREVFDKIGYVDEGFDACEDVEFNYRLEQAGLTCYSSPKLTIRYYPRENLRGLFRQMSRYGKGRRRFTRKHPPALSFNQLIPAVFVAGLSILILSGIWSLVSGHWSLVTGQLSIIFGLYFLLTIVESVRLVNENGWKYMPELPPIFFAIHFGLGYGFIAEAVKVVFLAGNIAKPLKPSDMQTSKY